MVEKKKEKKKVKKKVEKKEVKEENNGFSFNFSIKFNEEGLDGNVSFNPGRKLSEEQKLAFEALFKNVFKNIHRMNTPMRMDNPFREFARF